MWKDASWPTLRWYSSIWMEGLNKNMGNLCQDSWSMAQDVNPGSSKSYSTITNHLAAMVSMDHKGSLPCSLRCFCTLLPHHEPDEFTPRNFLKPKLINNYIMQFHNSISTYLFSPTTSEQRKEPTYIHSYQFQLQLLFHQRHLIQSRSTRQEWIHYGWMDMEFWGWGSVRVEWLYER
jgi:hypothetical protein